RGYHRGFRRPYNFRGRGRGYFPRGRYQRGGGGYNNNNHQNYRSNWKNYKQNPQKQQHQQQNNSRGRSHNVQKRSGSPPHGHPQHSDRSSSPLSRHSQQSSSSSHSSSPPKCRPDAKEEQFASKEVQKGGGGDEEPAERAGLLAGEAREGAGGGKTEGSWQGLADYSGSLKKNSPVVSAAVTVGQNSPNTSQANPAKVINDTGNGAPAWQTGCSSSATKSAPHEGLNPMLSSFDFFSNEEYLDGDKAAISIAFRKFLEEQNKKAKSARENCKNTEANAVEAEQGKVNGKTSTVTSESLSRKRKEDDDGEVSLSSFLKASPFLSADVEEEEEIIVKPPSKSLHKDWHNGDESSKPKTKVTHSARELFEECFGKWQNATFSQFANSDLDAIAEEIYRSGKQDKAVAIAAALAKREFTVKYDELSSDTSCKERKMLKSPSIASSALPPRRNSDREMFLVRGEDPPLAPSRKQETKVNVRMDLFGDAEERQLSQDLVQASKKDQEFRSIFQHVQAAPPLQRCPSELFAQHIVAIVHHIKAQHFPSSGMTLNERFTLYQRQAAEKEMMKPRKSDPTDLRLDIERRKKYSTHDRDHNQDGGRDMGESLNSSRERSVERLSKHRKKSKKSKNKRSRSSSSSSSSSSKSQKEEDMPRERSNPKDESCNRVRMGQRESPGDVETGRPRGGFQVRIRGRGWNRGNYQGNSSNSNAVNVAVQQKNEDWNPEYTPKSKKYYLHDDRDESECKWMDNRGRGRGGLARGRARFIIRKATGASNGNSLKWALDTFPASEELRRPREEEADQDHKGAELNGT
uniref:Thyroid hormone receptor associated protein 3a n=1 Tax=Salarias fasciatus TaxID=181472 RepID=A0A672GQM9_SALFA